MRAFLSRGLAALLLAGSCLSAAATLPTVPTAAAEPVHTSFGAAGLLQAGLGLGLVLAMIFGCAWLVRRFGLQPGGNGRLLKVVCSAMVVVGKIIRFKNGLLITSVSDDPKIGFQCGAPDKPLRDAPDVSDPLCTKWRLGLVQDHAPAARPCIRFCL